jgi:hypothetical protein
VQQLHASSPGDSSAASPGEASRFHEGTDGVDLVWDHIIPGWSEPVGIASNIRFGDVQRLVVRDEFLRCQPFFFEHITLAHTAHLMVMQGLPLSQLFAGLFRATDRKDRSSVQQALPGPWVFLSGRLSPMWDVPVIRNVILVRFFEPIQKELAGDVLKALVTEILNPALDSGGG